MRTISRRSFLKGAAGAALAMGVLANVKPEQGAAKVQAADDAEAVEGGVKVEECEESATGYRVTFTYVNADATNVQLKGNFMFSVENDENTYANGYNLPEGEKASAYFVRPEDWEKGQNLCNVGVWSDFTGDMTKDEETAAWTYTMDLPGGMYEYLFNVSYNDGAHYDGVYDPENEPGLNRLGAHEKRSMFFVPYNADKQEPQNDWTYAFPAENAGKLYATSYISKDGIVRPAEVYLPAGYDENREEPYKVLYLSHGGGGQEADWTWYGCAGNIMDNLAAAGETEEFIIVTMNHVEFNWDYDAIFENTTEYLVPFMEKNYNVSTESSGRAFAGLSMGGMTTSEMLLRDPSYFGYFGIFSGSAAYDVRSMADPEALKQANIFVGAGWVDMAAKNSSYGTEEDRTSEGLVDLFNEWEVPFNNGDGICIVQGAHDWWTWPALLKNFIETMLWK